MATASGFPEIAKQGPQGLNMKGKTCLGFNVVTREFVGGDQFRSS